MMKFYLILSVLWLVFIALNSIDAQYQTSDQNVTPLDDATHRAILESDGESDSGIPGLSSERQSHSNPLNFLNIILDPIRSTLGHTKRILGSGAGNVQEGIDKIRLKTYRLFLRAFNKSMPSVEELSQRATLFFDRREAIKESVKAFREGRDSFAMKLNEFVDWNDDELKQLTGVSMPPPEEMIEEERAALLEHSVDLVKRRTKRSISSSGNSLQMNRQDEMMNEIEDDDDDIGLKVGETIPATKDWRDSGCLAAPVDQKTCGACYAIATMGTLESMRCLNQDSAAILSSQQIIDCSTSYKNFGCNGGWPTRVLKYLQDNGVATREACYPFVRRQTTCRVSVSIPRWA